MLNVLVATDLEIEASLIETGYKADGRTVRALREANAYIRQLEDQYIRQSRELDDLKTQLRGVARNLNAMIGEKR